jgi:dTMP kinase
LTVLFDIEPSIAQKRLRGRPGGQNEIDRRSVEFHERVREGFHDQAQAHCDCWVVIDASQPLDEVARQALEAVQAALTNQARA